MKHRVGGLAGVVLACVAAISLGCVRHADPPADSLPSTQGYGVEVSEGLARVRQVTASFRTLDSAVAAGYPRDVRQCLQHPRLGGMGYHHVNRQYADARVDVDHPEILLYERKPDGSYALTGVEYIVPYSRVPRDSAAPKVFGLDLKQSDDLNLWYLHMWAWKPNPNGLFADWNPGVKCPAPSNP